ncbi:MAG: hypothetical protein QG604_765 [Candidatus Dependentiae bacterium]|nr:hypothetical protein [Candidatus Dependentiae bacterium]
MAQWLVRKLSKLMRISVRTLHHYDEINLLKPSIRLDNGYRLYSEADLQRLQQILALKFLGFELVQIKEILGKEISTVAHLRVQATLLRKKAQAMLSASEALDVAIVKCEEQKSVDWQTIIDITEVYSMIDAFKDTQVAQILNDEELKQLIEYFTVLYKDKEYAAYMRDHYAALSELQDNLAQDPTGQFAMDWVVKANANTQYLSTYMNKKTEAERSEITAIFTGLARKAQEMNKTFLELAAAVHEPVSALVGSKFSIVPVTPTPEMSAWMQKAQVAYAALPENSLPSGDNQLAEWIEHYTAIASDAAFVDALQELSACQQSIVQHLDTDPTGDAGQQLLLKIHRQIENLAGLMHNSRHHRIVFSAIAGGFGVELDEERKKRQAIIQEALDTVHTRTGVLVPMIEGPLMGGSNSSAVNDWIRAAYVFFYRPKATA